MDIRKYKSSDLEAVSWLFYETIHNINARDYTQEQLRAWASNAQSLQKRKDDLLCQHTLIAEIDKEIVGFGSIDKYGCLDLLFVRKDKQGQGIATALCDELEKKYSTVKTYASITAKGFFERRGYTLIKEQEVERNGIKLKNYEMRK